MSVNAGDRPLSGSLDDEDLHWPSGGQRVLVPFREAVDRTESGLLGAGIALGTDGELYLVHALGEAAGTDPDRGDAELKTTVRDRVDVPVVERRVPYSRSLLPSFVDAHTITTVLLDSEEEGFLPRVGPDWATGADCHTVVGTGLDAFEPPASILVPVSRGPHSELATRVAAAIAAAYDSWIELMHVVPADAPEPVERDARELLDAYGRGLRTDVEVDHHVLRGPDPADLIDEHTSYHDLTVLGAPEKGKLRRTLFGSTTDAVTDSVDATPVLTTHRNAAGSVLGRWI